MLLSAHTPSRSDGNAALNAAEWLSLAAAADGSAGKPSGGMASPGGRIAGRVADWLSLAAAPTFAIMAVLTATTGNADMICMTTPDAFPLGGMVPMYLLMSGFHLAPWLRLAAGKAPKFMASP
ncbi:hypothetical protein [Rhizobium leguminosarum]|uniref:Uncharacterized protein n=1 Tax=Rhizobium leguminosarum TaxID=384 RepID=A0A4Q8Y4G1_RHILE|nr:hypothetical protein [Rhizobium leguminosarum]TAU84368.1 hypothetical protein ELI40_14460 [Rhizobium leguminosarum]TAV90192.1 hypothetical protein ELI22_13635 [Rhizobium leguminosarum]TAV94799.1 hypothetical protein ELI21_13800 [Rhizobium leguminosarum]TAW35876.1 hypothetical protein ELI23_13835 [Rhizobium leguminosarum]TAX10497.1 hypothetical protein ELI07_13855 [Rhizobium leguminosarum]